MKEQKTQNKGEISEVYVFFRILGDHAIYPCDKELKRTGSFFPVLSILRGDSDKKTKTFSYNEQSKEWSVDGEDTQQQIISPHEGTLHADELLVEMNKKSKEPRNYQKALKFLSYIGVHSYKASSKDKKDISLQISDVRAGTTPTCGFSIKSYIGGSPTLLNSSGDCTNFLYEVVGLSYDDVKEANSLDKTGKRMEFISSKYASLSFINLCSDTFKRNLYYIDSCMYKILGEILKIFYTKKMRSVKDATEFLANEDPLLLGDPGPYRECVKRLLVAVALGMTPGHRWEGKTDETSGFLIVKPDGEVVTYHIYNHDAFKEYLYLFTYFDSPDRSRHKFGTLYIENNRIYIKLALQIRFSKPHKVSKRKLTKPDISK